MTSARKPCKATRQLTRKLSGESARHLAAGRFAFPSHVELDEFGFDTATGGAAFESEEDRLIPRPSGRPPKVRF